MTDEKDLIRDDIEAYLAKYRKKELLRFVSVGSVDDGKSTLIGRILYDTGMVFEDQMAAVRAASQSEEPDLALLTDGLKAEREQGITIDVAYRYFATDKRKFIIADTPGHIQYTRNMVTGASTADVALILIDARHGVLQQSRRHAYIASLLGIPHLAVCVNKMDLKDYSQEVYDEICADFMEFGKTLRFKDIQFFPVSALVGDNVVSDSDSTPWYDGPNVLEYLETVPVFADRNFDDFRYPVQYVIRPDLDYRGFAAEVSSGVIAKGDEIVALPSGKTSKVKAIDTYDGELEEAFAGQSVTIRLEDEIDISRGDMIVKPGNLPGSPGASTPTSSGCTKGRSTPKRHTWSSTPPRRSAPRSTRFTSRSTWTRSKRSRATASSSTTSPRCDSAATARSTSTTTSTTARLAPSSSSTR